MLITKLLLLACLDSFLIDLSTTVPGMGPPTWATTYPIDAN